METVFDEPEKEKSQEKGGVVVGCGHGGGQGRNCHMRGSSNMR